MPLIVIETDREPSTSNHSRQARWQVASPAAGEVAWLAEDLEQRRKRLAFRAWHRGMKELDLLIGRFAECHLADMDEGQLDRFEELLGVPEPVLYDWLTGKAEPEAAFDHEVTRQLLNFNYSANKG